MALKQVKENVYLSVIVPIFNQEKTVRENLMRLKAVLKELTKTYEIIAVVDGFTDKSFENAKKAESSNVHVVGYKHNRGKGHALRFGMDQAKGTIIAFIDSGTDLNPSGLSMLLAHFTWYDADIIVGSKWHPVSKVSYPFYRKIISLGYGLLVKLLFGLRVRDTQLGMKLFKREVLEKVLPRLLVKRYAIDIEILAVADRLGFTRIFEAPIELDWSDIDSSISKNLFANIWNMFWDTLAVFYRLKIRKYYDDSSKRNWVYDPELQLKVNVP